MCENFFYDIIIIFCSPVILLQSLYLQSCKLFILSSRCIQLWHPQPLPLIFVMFSFVFQVLSSFQVFFLVFIFFFSLDVYRFYQIPSVHVERTRGRKKRKGKGRRNREGEEEDKEREWGVRAKQNSAHKEMLPVYFIPAFIGSNPYLPNPWVFKLQSWPRFPGNCASQKGLKVKIKDKSILHFKICS